MKRLLIFLIFLITSTPVSAKEISIMSWNVGDSDHKAPNALELSRALGKHRPDIFIIQEVFYERFLKLKKIYNYKYHIHSSQLSSDLKNLGILSNYKINDSNILVFKKKISGVLISNLNIENTSFTIASVHLSYIRTKKRDQNGYVKFGVKSLATTLYKEILKKNERLTEAKTLLEKIGKPGKKTILAGDFNTITYSSSIRKIKKYYKDSFSGIKNFFSSKSTYKKIKFPIKPRVDFIFHSDDILIKSSKVIKNTPGDHYPVWVNFNIL